MNAQTRTQLEPFTVVAGCYEEDVDEADNSGVLEENIKYLRSYATLWEALKDSVLVEESYPFARIEYKDPLSNDRYEILLNPLD